MSGSNQSAATDLVVACPLCGATGSELEAELRDVFFGYPGEWPYYRCPATGCGIAWIARPLPHDQLMAAYGRYYTHEAPPPGTIEVLLGRLFAGRQGPFPLIPLLYREAENHRLDSGGLPPLASGLALDVGCGSGERLDYLRAIGWGSAEGIDPDPAAVASGERLGRPIRLGSAEAIPHEPGSADAVFMHHVVEHVVDLRQVLTEARRVLRPGGHLVITTPNLDSAGRTRWGPWWRGYEAPRHLQLYTLAALGRALADAGFTVIEGRTSARAAPFMHRESSRVAGTAQAPGWKRWWLDDREMLAATRRQRAGATDGEELFVVGRAD